MDMHIILVIIFLVAAAAILFWFLQQVTIPAPFNIILYAVLAMLALYILGSLLGVWGGGGFHLTTGWNSPLLNIPALA